MGDRPSLPYGDAEYVQETARRIAMRELMVADLEQHAWQASLALMMDRLATYGNVGLILVPKADHLNMPWIDNTAPGCTIKCQMLAIEDLDALQTELTRLEAALYPQQQGTGMEDSKTITVNGVEAEEGLFVDGDVHGIYSDDRLADIAVGFGLALTDDTDPRHWRALINTSAETGEGMEEYFGEQLDESSTKLLELLNTSTDGGWFEWLDGSVFLVRGTDEDDDDED